MTLKEAVAFLKGAVARSMPGGATSTYTVFNGWLYAQSPAILAAYPVPHMQGLYSMAADDLEGALARMPTEPELSAGEGTIILKGGRLRSSIQLLEADEPATTGEQISDGDNETQNLPDGLIRAMALALGFVSTDGTWQRGVYIESGRVMGVNNRCGIEVALQELAPPAPCILTSECVTYVTKLNDAPATVRFAGDYVLFRWPSNAWARCQAMNAVWPREYLDTKIFNNVEDIAPIELTADWRASFDDIASIAKDGGIELRPDGIFGLRSHSDHTSEFETGVTRTSYWSLEALKPVFACAEHWNPDARSLEKPDEPGGARFTAPGLRGVVVGQRR